MRDFPFQFYAKDFSETWEEPFVDQNEGEIETRKENCSRIKAKYS